MARFGIDGLDALMLDLAEMMDIPDDVTDEMLLAGAEVAEEAQIHKAVELGIYRTGETVRSITHTKPKKGSGGKSISVYPQGVNSDGNRNAEVMFLNEFGVPSKKMPAKQAVRLANEEAADEIVTAEEKAYSNWLDSLGL